MKVKYTKFGKTKLTEAKVFLNSKEIKSETWDVDYWIEREEDWYGLMCQELYYKRVLVVERSNWLRGIDVV